MMNLVKYSILLERKTVRHGYQYPFHGLPQNPKVKLVTLQTFFSMFISLFYPIELFTSGLHVYLQPSKQLKAISLQTHWKSAKAAKAKPWEVKQASWAYRGNCKINPPARGWVRAPGAVLVSLSVTPEPGLAPVTVAVGSLLDRWLAGPVTSTVVAALTPATDWNPITEQKMNAPVV